MFVDFKKVKFKNVLSYGNNWTELDFKSRFKFNKSSKWEW